MRRPLFVRVDHPPASSNVGAGCYRASAMDFEEICAQSAAMREALEAEEEAFQLYRAAAMLAPGTELRAMRERWREATSRAAELRRRVLGLA